VIIAGNPENETAVTAAPVDGQQSATSSRTPKLIKEVQDFIDKTRQDKFGAPGQPHVEKDWPIEKMAVINGRLPDGLRLDPRPRDFRPGKFKWKSTSIVARPTRHDLRETLRLGVPGTAMPPFKNVPAADVNSDVENVRWLSMAGEFASRLNVEFTSAGFGTDDVARRLADGENRSAILKEALDMTKDATSPIVDDALQEVMMAWETAEQEETIVRSGKQPTPSSDQSVARGKSLFLHERLKCASCHGITGKGDGEYTKLKHLVPGTGKEAATPGLHDDWGNLHKVPDLTNGVFHGGDDPESLYRRLMVGICGTAMPGYATLINDDDAWDLMNFLQSLRPADSKGKSIAPRQPTPPGLQP
jgi:mono/diheme cytochrome c family protein